MDAISLTKSPFFDFDTADIDLSLVYVIIAMIKAVSNVSGLK